MNATPETLPKVPQAAPAAALAKKRRSPFLIGLGVVVVLFVVTYIFAWIRSQALSQEYMANANSSYEEGDYLRALVGFEEFDEDANRYVARGGYFQVQRIWASSYAWPVPAGVETAQQRIDEIINERLTIEDAEQFIQVSAGRGNPYLGIIYLRLGELYEEDGDERSAREIYEEIPELFAGQQSLIDRAADHLNRLGASESDQ
jgi:tetratricopeptide (TPR) repeat protein